MEKSFQAGCLFLVLRRSLGMVEPCVSVLFALFGFSRLLPALPMTSIFGVKASCPFAIFPGACLAILFSRSQFKPSMPVFLAG